MSLTRVTIKARDYASYASVAKADAALAVDPVRGATWSALDEEAKGIRLVAATNRLDLLRWLGRKTGGASQENEWPRSSLVYPDGTPVPSDTVPRKVERATILLAGSIASTPSQANAGTSGAATKRVKAGSSEVEFFHRRESVTGKPIQDETVFELIRQWIEGRDIGTGSTGPVATGTDSESAFENAGRYGRTKGLA